MPEAIPLLEAFGGGAEPAGTPPPREAPDGPRGTGIPLLDAFGPEAQMGQARARARQEITAPPGVAETAIMHSAPFLSPILGHHYEREYGAAHRRVREGTADPQDYHTVAGHERLQELESQGGLGRRLATGLASVPALLGEAYLTGGIAPVAEGASLFSRAGLAAAGRAAVSPSAYGRLAARTVATPSLYAEDWARRASQAGRDPLSLEGLSTDAPPAVAHGMLANAVLGSLGHAGNSITGAGILPVARRVLARTSQGMVEQQGIDALAGAVSEILPEALQLSPAEGRYGRVGDILRAYRTGNYDPAVGNALVEAVTFAAFGLAHERGDPAARDRARRQALADLQGRAEQILARPGREPSLSTLTGEARQAPPEPPPPAQEAPGPQAPPPAPPAAPDRLNDMRAYLRSLGAKADELRRMSPDQIAAQARQMGFDRATEGTRTQEPQRPATYGAPEEAPGTPQAAPEPAGGPEPSPQAPEVAANAPEAPAADPVERAGRAFGEIFPEAAPSASRPGVLRAESGGRWVELAEGQSPDSVRLDFGWLGERTGRGNEPGDQPIVGQLGGLVRRLREAGANVEYVAVGGRERGYAALLRRAGYEQVSGPTGEGGELRVWRPREAGRTSVPPSGTEAPAEPPQATAGVPVMMTQAMRAQLRARGYSEQAVNAMRPQEAWDRINGLVQRIEEPGVGRADFSKPQGIYTSPAAESSPHAGLGGARFVWRRNPEARVLTIRERDDPGIAVRRGATTAGAGVWALREITGPEEFARLKGLSLRDLRAEAARLDPSADWTRYTDRQEVLEGMAGVLARRAGYDAIELTSGRPGETEYVGLTPRSMEEVVSEPPQPSLVARMRQRAQGREVPTPEVQPSEAEVDRLRRQAQTGRRVEPEQFLAAKGLTPQEQQFTVRIANGESLQEAGRALGVRSRQRAHQIAARVAEKLGLDVSLVEHFQGGEGALLRPGNEPPSAEDVEVARHHARTPPDQLERQTRAVKQLADQLEAEAARGPLSEERRAYYASEGRRLAGLPAENPAGTPAAVEPAPVRREGVPPGRPQHPEAPPAGEGGPAGGRAQAPQGPAETPGPAQGEPAAPAPAAARGGEAAGDELTLPPSILEHARTLHRRGDGLAWEQFLGDVEAVTDKDTAKALRASLGRFTETTRGRSERGHNRQFAADLRRHELAQEIQRHEAARAEAADGPEAAEMVRQGAEDRLGAGEPAPAHSRPGDEAAGPLFGGERRVGRGNLFGAEGGYPGELPQPRLEFGAEQRAAAERRAWEAARAGSAEPPGSEGQPPEDWFGEPGGFGRPVTEGGMPGGGQPGAREARQPPTALANEVMEAERRRAGRDQLAAAASLANPQVWDAALEAVRRDPEAASRLVEELSRRTRATTVQENALLLQRKVALRNEYERTVLDYLRAGQEGADAITRTALERREAELSGQIDQLDRVTRSTGTEWGRAGQFRRQMAEMDYSLGGMLMRARGAFGRPLTEAEVVRVQNLQREITAAEGQLRQAEEGTGGLAGAGPEGETPRQLATRVATSPEVRDLTRAQTRQRGATGEFGRMLAEGRQENKPFWQKMEDWLVKLRRAFILSSPTTLAKLTAAGAERMVFTPVEEAVGGVLSRVPGLSRIAALAPREGRGLNRGAEVRAFGSAFSEGMRDAWQALRTGQSELDVLHGNREPEARAGWTRWLDMVGELHAALKAPVKRNEYTRSLLQRLEQGAAQGRDVTSPAALAEIGARAYQDANRAVFMQDNRVTQAWNAAVARLRAPDASAGSRALGLAADLLVPIKRVPTNIVAETLQYATGLVTGSVGAARALRRGVETLKPAEADLIMRQLKKGSLGAAALALGYLAPGVFGGFYSGRRRPGDEEAMAIGGVPGTLLHNPLLEAAQVGATVRRAQDEVRRGQSGSLGEGVLAGATALVEETPFGREAVEVSRLVDSRQRGRAFGELAKSFSVPTLLQWLGGRLDTETGTPFGPQVRRQARTLLEHVRSGVPGLRNQLPRAR